MASAEFHHYGVPTNVKGASEVYIEGAKVFVTDPDSHPYRIEFLRFEDGSPLHEAVQKNPHAAFVVPNLDEALKGQNVIIPPFDATAELRCAFVDDGGAILELMERR